METPWLKTKYKKINCVRSFPIIVDGFKFFILINPDIGSWVVLKEKELEDYNNENINSLLGENLYLRKLAQTDDGRQANLIFPQPANYPSVVVLNVTTKCNLCCKYCFAESCPTRGEDMKEKVITATVDQMLNMPEVKKITFEFQGGEPLLNLRAIETCIEYANEQAPKYKKIVAYRVESNGTLINDTVIQLLKKYNVEIGVSIDGPEEFTNQVRIYPNGRGAFKDIWQGIEKLRQNGIEIAGSVCTIGKHNVDHPDEIVDFFYKAGIGFKPRPVNILGRELKNKIAPDNEAWYKCFVRMYYRSKELGATNFSIHIFEENVYTPIRDYICLRYPCGLGREIISVNPNGDVFPCDGFKAVPQFKIGNILEEPITKMLEKSWIKKIRNRTYNDIPKCRSCLFHAMCGSCVYSCYGAFNNIYREDPSCSARSRIFRFLIEEWIRRNILQSEKKEIKENNHPKILHGQV
ncbi:MAG: radical SAM protein [Candidatus Omnitrophica bacterium]|nr:radical SAM protein [Candidatus Omnitrophota bacterium]